MEIKIKNKNPKELYAYPKNNKKHPKKQIDRLAQSIDEYGFNQPVLLDANDIIVCGHARVEASIQLGLTSIPCIYVDHLTDKQIRQYRILDNKIAMESEWDFESLAPELAELEALGVDMSFGGLDELNKLFPEDIKETQEDDYEAKEQTETYIKLGDIIELGEHRLMCGDSTDAEQVAELMQGKEAESVLTDPPYGVKYVGKTKHALTIDGDNNGEVAIAGVKNAINSLSKGGAIYICYPAEDLIALAEIWKEPAKLQSMLVWVKQTIVMGRKDYHYRHEPIWYGWKEGSAHRFKGDRTNQTVIEFDRPKRNAEHPTMKPVELIAFLIKNSTLKGELILDPFLGSGTTLIACEQLGRICYGMEISPTYCQVIIDRYRSFCEKNNKEFKCKINGELFP